MNQLCKWAGRLGRNALGGLGRTRTWLGATWAARRASLMARSPLQRLMMLVLWACAALFGAMLLLVLAWLPFTPGIADLKQVREAKPSTLLSSDGKLLASFDEGQHQRVGLDKVSRHVVEALVATEDHRFYEHSGVDFKRTAGAIVYTLMGDAQGGSTITQQLARNMFPEQIGRSRNVTRKIKEVITALKIEATYSKEEILEAYLNTVPFLYNSFGIDMAARTYFGKSAARLDILESATLVGMLKGTKYYNPVSNPERSKARRNVVLGQMHKHGLISDKRLKSLRKRALRLRFSRQSERSESATTHFTAQVRKWMIEWADENDYNLQLDGLVVHTTLDSRLQQAALQAVVRQGRALQIIADVEWAQADSGLSRSSGAYAGMHHAVTPFEYFWTSKRAVVNAFVRETPEYREALAAGESGAAALKRLKADRAFIAQLRSTKTRLEAGLVAIDPASGAVRAWVGSRDFAKEQFDHVSQAQRQPGSTFKPMVYGAALEQGVSAEHRYRDAVLDIKAADGSVWRPTDMSGTSGREMSMRDGLVYSKNTITAQVMQDVGLPDIIKLARALGIRDSDLSAVPSLALGTSPVTLLEMVSAYSTIAAQGQYRAPLLVQRISDRFGNLIAEFGGAAPEQAMSQASAEALVDMLRGVIRRGTGTALRTRFGIDADVAGKTGTTQNNADGWFILMHPQLVGGAWVGFNDSRVTMRSNYWGQGGHNAVLLVGDFFKTALERGQLDSDALFPGGKRRPVRRAPEPKAEPAPEPQDIDEYAGSMEQEGGAPEPVPTEQPEQSEQPQGESGHGALARDMIEPEPEPAPVPEAEPQ